MTVPDIEVLLWVRRLLMDLMKRRHPDIAPQLALAACEVLERVMFGEVAFDEEESRSAYAREHAN